MEAMSFMNAGRRRERMRGNGSNAKRNASRQAEKADGFAIDACSLGEGAMQPKAAKTGVLRRYIFYEMQADQAVKAIQFAKLRVLIVITNICNSSTIGKACAAPPRRRTIAFGSPRRSARRPSARRCPIYSFAAASAVICALPQLG